MMLTPLKLIDKLTEEENLSFFECLELLTYHNDEKVREYLFEKARGVRETVYGKKIYIRGLIEFSNYCKNDCFYCGIRRSNKNAERYRLTKDEILSCCEIGYNLGFRTFVLQSGEDITYTDEIITDIVKTIRNKYPDCAITLSVGERSFEAYKSFFDAGANRFLLRHETYDKEHYGKLHPDNLSFDNRIECLKNLRKIGYQVGTGFMVGSPYQTMENIVNDILFIKEFGPQMIGIGPFISHKDTPFCNFENGTVSLTTFIIGILRLMNKNALIPSTTALGTIDENGREKGILAGANVVMPNLSPENVRKKYYLYDNKIATGLEAAEYKEFLEEKFKKIGYDIVIDRGDYIKN